MSGDRWRTERWHVQPSPIGGPCITASPASPEAADADVIVDLIRSDDIAEHIAALHNASLDAARLDPVLRELLEHLTDEDPCWFDHHGYCQAHGWMETEPRCPHARAKELLAASPAD